MKRYISIGFVMLLFGCELVVDVDIPIEKQALVINSFFNPDSTWKAKVSLNRHILDAAPYPAIEDAVVVVFEGDLPIDTLQHDSLGYYRSPSGRPEPGKNYAVRAFTAQHGNAFANSTCPELVAAEFSTIQKGVDESGMPEYSFTISFKDQPGQQFYQVSGIGEYRYTNPYTGQGFLNRSNLYLWCDDDGIDDEELPNTEGFFFPDHLFNGEEFSINVKLRPNYWGTKGDRKYFIYFRSVSHDYFKYKTTSLVQNYTSGDPFAQPVKVYTNVENGLGIFAGFSQRVMVLEE